MSNLKVFDNFLEKKDFEKIKEVLFSNYFPWYFIESSTDLRKDQFQFFHLLYSNYTRNDYFQIINPLIKKINPAAIHRIKVNLNTKTEKIIETGLHDDLENVHFTSGVYFINDCDGYLRIGDKKIYSKENTFVTFPSHLTHTGTTCTNVDRRVLINIIYIE